MLKLEPAKMTKAIERAKSIRPRVRVISAAERTYSVTGSRGNAYTVRFAVVEGRRKQFAEPTTSRSLTLPTRLMDILEEEAWRSNRTVNQQLAAILDVRYNGADVELHIRPTQNAADEDEWPSNGGWVN